MEDLDILQKAKNDQVEIIRVAEVRLWQDFFNDNYSFPTVFKFARVIGTCALSHYLTRQDPFYRPQLFQLHCHTELPRYPLKPPKQHEIPIYRRLILLPDQLCTKGLWLPIAAGIIKGTSERYIEEATMASEQQNQPKPRKEAEEVALKLVLMCTQTLFEERGALPEKTFDKVMDSGKKILGRSTRAPEVRSVSVNFQDLEVGTGVRYLRRSQAIPWC